MKWQISPIAFSMRMLEVPRSFSKIFKMRKISNLLLICMQIALKDLTTLLLYEISTCISSRFRFIDVLSSVTLKVRTLQFSAKAYTTEWVPGYGCSMYPLSHGDTKPFTHFTAQGNYLGNVSLHHCQPLRNGHAGVDRDLGEHVTIHIFDDFFFILETCYNSMCQLTIYFITLGA